MREALVQIAQSQVGIAEPAGDDKYIRWYNRETGAGFPMTAPWCQIFICWCMDQVGMPRERFPMTASCTAAMGWSQNAGDWQDREDYRPRPGDLIYFDWDRSGDSDHVGIIEKVHEDRVETIEGNVRDAVRRKSYALSDSRIRGFVVPRFPETDENAPSPWAAEACAWAVEAGLFIGDENGVIDWHEPVAKEDLAVVLYRYNKVDII